MLSEEQAEEIRKRLEKAQPGPWDYQAFPGYGAVFHGPKEEAVCDAVTPGDAIFIAHARQDIPALLSERERLIGEVDRRHGIGGELIIARRERDEAVARALKAEAEVERITNRWMDACDREAQQSALIEKLAGALRTVQGIAYPLAWAGIAGHDSIVRVVDPALAAIPKSETPDRG